MPKGYVIVDIDIEDASRFGEYASQIPELIEKHGGKYLVRGPKPAVVLDNFHIPEHLVVIEFPSQEAARAFFDERQSLGLADLFASSTTSRVLLVPGTG